MPKIPVLPLVVLMAGLPAAAQAATPPTCWDGSKAKGTPFCITVPGLLTEQQITSCGEGAPWTCPPPRVIRPIGGTRKPPKPTPGGKGRPVAAGAGAGTLRQR